MNSVDLSAWQPLLEDLGPLLAAVAPYGRSVVVSGGVVPLLYRYLPDIAPVRQPPLLTADLDLTVARSLDGPRLDQRLRQADFVEVYSRAADPPVIRLQHRRFGSEELHPVHVEFLAPQTAPRTGRGGVDQRVVEVQPGVHAQALPYLQVLFEEPIALASDAVGWLPAAVRVHVPHPAAYLLVKALVIGRRAADAKRAKDAAYLYDVALLTRDRWDELVDFWVSLRDRGRCPARWLAAARETIVRLFAAASSDGPIWVHRVYADAMGAAAPAESAVARVAAHFIERLGECDAPGRPTA